MWYIEGEDVEFRVEYLIDDQYTIPNSAVATVRDASGAALPNLSSVALDVSSTSTSLTIQASDIALSGDVDHAAYFVTVSFVWQNQNYHVQSSFKVSRFLPITGTCSQVRSELGLDVSELRDEDIDLTSAYFWLKAEYSTSFTDALQAGDQTALAANKAVVIRAALDIVDSLPFRAAVKTKAEDSAFDRVSEFFAPEIKLRLGQKLADVLGVMTGDVDEGQTILVVATPTDAVTGA